MKSKTSENQKLEKIALKISKMSDTTAKAVSLGKGMPFTGKEDAIDFLKSIGYTDGEIKNLKESKLSTVEEKFLKSLPPTVQRHYNRHRDELRKSMKKHGGVYKENINESLIGKEIIVNTGKYKNAKGKILKAPGLSTGGNNVLALMDDGKKAIIFRPNFKIVNNERNVMESKIRKFIREQIRTIINEENFRARLTKVANSLRNSGYSYYPSDREGGTAGIHAPGKGPKYYGQIMTILDKAKIGKYTLDSSRQPGYYILQLESKKPLKEKIDIKYWLGYAGASPYGHDDKNEEWYTDPKRATSIAIKRWNSEAESYSRVKPNEVSKILNFAKEFISSYKKVDIGILLAYISQS